MMTIKTIFASVTFALLTFLYPIPEKKSNPNTRITQCYPPEGCVFKTIFEDDLDNLYDLLNTPDNIKPAIENGLNWIINAQHQNGGWGAGSHYNQHVRDPHAVNPDPATTAMVSMALIRTGSDLHSGPHTTALQRSTEYLLKTIEHSKENSPTITEEVNTQIQTKLGQNIDAIMALQYLTMVHEDISDVRLKSRILNAMEICTSKIQQTQDQDGSFSGGGWAGVIQSSLANNALESAKAQGVNVDDQVLDKSREYQKANYDAGSGSVRTDQGAGIVLYSVSGTVRATAKDARRVKEEVKKAKEDGRIEQNAPVTAEVLEEIGFGGEDAERYANSYEIYESTKSLAQDEGVMSGFGNNGGEEFLSYLQTGESLIINQDDSWVNWYDNMSGKLLAIQNQDGSWNGHHCITSPVFCTATSLMILSINNDAERLIELGEK